MGVGRASDLGAIDIRLIPDHLGHRDHRLAVHYTRIAAGRFEGIWRSTSVERDLRHESIVDRGVKNVK